MRRLQFLLVVLLFLPAVAAQVPIELEQDTVSLFVVVPAVVIGLMLLVLVVATFRQNVSRIVLRFMSLKRMFRREKAPARKEEEKEEAGISKEEFDAYMLKVNELEKQVPSATPEESFRGFTLIAKDFFSKLVGGDHAYTDEEIAQNLERKRKVLLEFSERVSDMKYSGYQPSREEVVALINQFRKVVAAQIKRQKGEVSPISKNLIARIVQEDVKIFDSIRQYVETLKSEDKKKQIRELLSEEQKALRANIKKAKRVYDDILKLYCQLPPDERKRVYPRLLRFYEGVNKMIFSSLYSRKSKEELAYFSRELESLRDVPERAPLLKRLVGVPEELPKVRHVEAAKRRDSFEIKLRIPRFRLPKFKVPRISMPKFKVPVVHKGAPQHPVGEKPVFAIPKFKLPELRPRPRSLELPELHLPDVEKAVKVPELPGIKKPSVFAVLKRKLFAPKARPTLDLVRTKPLKFGMHKPEPVEDEVIAEAVMPKPPELVPVRKPVFRPQKPPFTFRKPLFEVRIPALSRKPEVPEWELHDLGKAEPVVRERPRPLPKTQKLTPEEEKIIDKINSLMSSIPGEIERVDYVRNVRKLLSRADAQLAAGNLSGAEITYESIKPLFMALSDEDKRSVHPEILGFYKKLRAALNTRKIKLEISVAPNSALVDEEEKLLAMLERLKGSIS